MTAGITRTRYDDVSVKSSVFSLSKHQFPGEPKMEKLVQDLDRVLDFRKHISDLSPTQGSTYNLGTDDRPWNNASSRGLTVHGTATLRNGVMQIRERGVLDFQTNSSLVIIPVYTNGRSPFDAGTGWHPASGYLRDGAIWIQKGSPQEYMARIGGVDRIIAGYDTTTSTYVGTTLWHRYSDDALRPYHRQYDDSETLSVGIGGDYFIETSTVSGGGSGTTDTAIVGMGLLGASLVGMGLLHGEPGASGGALTTNTVVWIKHDDVSLFPLGMWVGTNPDYVKVETNGDVSFVGGGGLQYGEISISDSSDVLDMASGVPQQVPFDTNGLSNGSVTPDHTNNHITVGLAGHYQILISMTLNSSAGIASKAKITCEVNDGDHEVITHQKRSLSGGGGESGAITLSGYGDLAANDTVEVWIEDEDTDSDYIVENCNLSVTQKGGT